MAAVAEENSYPQLTLADLKDPTVFRLNSLLSFIFSQLSQTQASVTAVVEKQAASSSGSGDGGSTPSIAAGSILYYTKTLTTDEVTLSILGAASGSFVAVVIVEDAVGGWKQTWPADFIGMAAYIQATDPNTFTSALFYTPDGTTFQLIGAPATGVL